MKKLLTWLAVTFIRSTIVILIFLVTLVVMVKLDLPLYTLSLALAAGVALSSIDMLM